MCTLHLIVSFEEGKKRRIYSTLFEKLLLNVRTMVQGPSVYVLPEPDVVWMYMTSAKISRIKNFANVGITAKSAKILLRENFPLYGRTWNVGKSPL